MQGRALLVSGYVFLVTLAAPTVLLASEDPDAVTPAEPVGAAPDTEAQAADPPIGGTESGSDGAAAPPDAAGDTTDSPPPVPVTDAPETSAAPAEPQTGKARRGEEPEASASATHTVLMRDIEFNPRNFTIDPGDTVRWENEDSEPHNAIGEDNSFETPVIDQGETSEHTFQNSGEYPYFCSLHQGMDGTITVRGSGSGGSGSGGSGSGGGSGDAASGTGGTAASGGNGGGTSATGSGGTTGSSSSSSLPATGLDVLWLGLIGWGLLALGAGLLLLGPRDA
jgi:plastocyanin